MKIIIFFLLTDSEYVHIGYLILSLGKFQKVVQWL